MLTQTYVDELQSEIEKTRQEIYTNSYSMSVGEWMSIYQDGDLNLHPKFQRFFRWSHSQKTKLIESTLLGIPIPPIFVSQNKDGKWDVIDGLQRLSTIFEFAGILENQNKLLVLGKAEYLPSLEGKVWDEGMLPKVTKQHSFWPEFEQHSALTAEQRRFIKRAKLGVSIILAESDSRTKYGLFQRLNTGGTQLSNQEVRNATLLMLNEEMFTWLENLSHNKYFETCAASLLTEKLESEQYDLELVLRFLILHDLASDPKKLHRLQNADVNDFLTNEMMTLAEQKDFDYDHYERLFDTFFNLLAETLGENSFKRYDPIKQKFEGGFRIPAYEAILLGLGPKLSHYIQHPEEVEPAIKSLWLDEAFIKRSGGGNAASYRIPKFVELVRKHF